MADNAVLTNKKTSFDADTNPDISVRTIDKAGQEAQVVIIDWGGSGAETFTPPTLTVTGTVTVNEPVSVDDNGGSLTVDGTVAATQSGTWNINNVSGTISLPTGAATEATLGTRLAEATFTTRINTQGQKAMAASTPVVIASDQSAVPVTSTPATLTAAAPTVSSVGTASGQILASATYKRVELVNTSTSTISIGIGSAAVLNSGMTLIGTGSSATIDGPFTAAVNAIASAAASNLAIQAFT